MHRLCDMSILHLHKGKITTDLARSNFYNVISLAARSRQCFMYITDFYWCVFSVPFFLLALLITIIYRFCYLVLIQKDIQRVRAKIHILKFMSAALHVGALDLNQKKDSWKRNFGEQVPLNRFVFYANNESNSLI